MVFIPLPFLSIAIFYVNHLINKKSDAIQQQLSVLNSFVQEAFSGIRILKSFGLEKAFEEAFETEEYYIEYKNTNTKIKVWEIIHDF